MVDWLENKNWEMCLSAFQRVFFKIPDEKETCLQKWGDYFQTCKAQDTRNTGNETGLIFNSVKCRLHPNLLNPLKQFQSKSHSLLEEKLADRSESKGTSLYSLQFFTLLEGWQERNGERQMWPLFAFVQGKWESAVTYRWTLITLKHKYKNT